MTALADTPVRLSKKARRRLAAVPRIPDHRELNPTTSIPLPPEKAPDERSSLSHPLPPGRGQGEGSSPSRATDLSSGQCSFSHPLPPGRGQGEGSSASPPPDSSHSESPAPFCALCASAVNPVFASLLPDFLSAELSLPALAERHNLSLLELIELLDSPQFIELIDRLNAIAERRAATVALHARPGALAGLESVIATTTSPETARKAAATIVRASDRVLSTARKTPASSPTNPATPPAGQPAQSAGDQGPPEPRDLGGLQGA